MRKYVSTYTEGTSAKDISNDAYAMFSGVYVCVFPIFFIIKAYVVGTHLNCINKSMQFKRVPSTYAFIKSRQKVYWLSSEDKGIA